MSDENNKLVRQSHEIAPAEDFARKIEERLRAEPEPVREVERPCRAQYRFINGDVALCSRAAQHKDGQPLRRQGQASVSQPRLQGAQGAVVISARRIRFSWPTVESTWDEIASVPQLSTFLLWKGKLAGAVFVRVFMSLTIITWLPLMLVPIPQPARVYGGSWALFVRWLLWEFYFGPKPPTIVLPSPGAKGLTPEQIEELKND